MSKIIRVNPLLLALFGTVMTRLASAEPVTNAYEIVSGQYSVCCGIAGELRRSLPNDSQSHVHLITDSDAQSARMMILGYFNAEPIFQIFEDGRIYPDRIEFGFPGPGPVPGLASEHYVVSTSASGLRINGATVRPLIGSDIPNRFAHSNVVANLLSKAPVRASVRVSSVEICWDTVSNQMYQVQYRLSAGPNEWTNLQSPILSTGGKRCVEDQVREDQPRRFYRVIPVP